MRGLIKRVVTEPGADTPEGFARRVRVLAVIYLVLFCACCAGEVVLAVHGKLFVTLAQRSNVETLIIAFLMVFYGYFAALSAPGAWGALRTALFAIRRRFSKDVGAERQRQFQSLGKIGDGPWAVLSKVVERTDGQPLRFELRDDLLSHGVVVVEGARVSQFEALSAGSADLLAYFVRQINDVTGQELGIVGWGLLDEAMLPDWEYEAEHKLPVIPEPLGLVSLSRSAERADPVFTMGFTTLIVLITLGILVLFVVDTPWVPG